jgi:hypothetical protein
MPIGWKRIEEANNKGLPGNSGIDYLQKRDGS